MTIRLACVLGVLLAAVACGPGKDALKKQHLEKGQQFAAQKKWPEAIVEFSAAIQQDAKFGEAYYGLAKAYDQNRQPKEAFGAYVRAADALPDNVDAQVKAATFLLIAQQYADARERAGKALALDPKNTAARIIMGNALAGLKDFDEAVREMRDAIEMDPGQGQGALYTNLGVMQLKNARGEEAEATFRKAIEVDPSSADAHLALANYYWSDKRLKEAEAEIREAIRVRPRHQIANRALAEMLTVTGRSSEAEAPLRTLADASNDPADRITLAAFLMNRGRTADARAQLEQVRGGPNGAALVAPRLAGLEYAQRNPARAYALLDEVLAKDPKNVPVLLARARLLSLDHKADEAFKTVSAAVAANPESAGAHYALGVLQQARNEPDAAFKSFSEALRLNPRAVPAQMRLASLNITRGAAATAVTQAQDAAKRQPENVNTRLTLARTLLAAGRIGEAEPQVKALVAATPQAAAVQSLAGTLFVRKKDLKAARQSYERALKLQPGFAEATAGLLNLDLVERKLPDARARVDAAVALTPQSVPTWLMAGVVYKASGDFAASERAFRKAIELDPDNAQGYAALGQLFFAQRKLDQARQEFEEMTKRDPKSVASVTMIAMILQLQGKTAEARQRYEAALRINPDAPVAANNLAWLYADSGEQLDTALELAQRAKQKSPDDPQVNDTLGWIYVKKHLAATAIPLLKQAVERSPRDASIHYHLGMAYLDSGDRDRGRQSLQAALQLQPDFAGAKDARQALSR